MKDKELIDILPTPSRSIPQVFYVGTDNALIYVGGMMELVRYLRGGELVD